MECLLRQAVSTARARRVITARDWLDSKEFTGSVAGLLAGGFPSFMELSYGKTLTRYAEQYSHFSGWTYVAISCIARRVAAQKVCMGRKATEPAPEGWAYDRPPGRKLQKWQKNFAPAFIKTMDTDIELIESDPLLDAIRRPNKIMGSWELLFFTICGLEITGLAYWWFVKEKDGTFVIWPVPSDWVTPIHTEKELFAQYRIRPLNHIGEDIIVDDTEIVRFALPDPSNPIGVVSPMQTQAPAIGLDEQIQIAQYRTLKNDAFPGLAIHTGRLQSMTGMGEGPKIALTDVQKRQLFQAVQQLYTGAQNYRLPLIVDGGLIDKVERLSFAPQELDFLNTGTAVKSRIFQAYGVNPYIAGEITGVNRAQAIVAEQNFLDNVCGPIATIISDKMTAHIGDTDVYFWLEIPRLEDPDLKLRILSAGGTLKTEDGKGLFTKNEWRDLAGLPHSDDGEEWVSAGAAANPFEGMFGSPGKKPPPKKPGDEEEAPATDAANEGALGEGEEEDAETDEEGA